jgi:hypothetical protein
MKEIIRHQLLFEGRVDDIKKKYPNLPADFIDELSKKDPSGDNKYLPWLVTKLFDYITRYERYDTKGEIDYYFEHFPTYITDYTEFLLKTVNLFHKYNDRLTPERVYEWYRESYGSIPNKVTIVRLPALAPDYVDRLGVWEPKSINTYNNPKDLLAIIDYIVKKYPSKSEVAEVTKKETTVIYNDNHLKIVAPKSHASSCIYGAETRWCTTAKDPHHFESYTSKNMVLIYFIFKEPVDSRELYSKAGIIIHGKNYPFKKIALWGNLKNKSFTWYDEQDEEVSKGNGFSGLSLLKAYCELKGLDFNRIKGLVNNYIKSKDERSGISKFIRPSNVR